MTKITDKIEWNKVLLTSNHNDDKIWKQHTHHFNTHKSKYKMRLFFTREIEPKQGSRLIFIWELGNDQRERQEIQFVHLIIQPKVYMYTILLVLNSFTPKISSDILLTICHTIIIMLVWRICYWINWKSPNHYSSLFSSLVCFVLHWHFKEKFSLGHSSELKG